MPLSFRFSSLKSIQGGEEKKLFFQGEKPFISTNCECHLKSALSVCKIRPIQVVESLKHM